MYIAVMLFAIAVAIYALIYNYCFPKSGTPVTNPVKVVIKTLAIIIVCYGFYYTFEISEKECGLSFAELGCIAEGEVIDDTEAMCKYLGISSESSMRDIAKKLEYMKYDAEDDIEDCIFGIMIYWISATALLFIHIKPKYLKINQKPVEITAERDTNGNESNN